MTGNRDSPVQKTSVRSTAVLSIALLLCGARGSAAQETDEPFFGEEQEPEVSSPLDRISIPIDTETHWGRGPFSIRDPHPLAQLHLSLHAFSPETTQPGEVSARVDLAWASSFSNEGGAFIDAETRRASIEFRDGISETSDFGIEIPFVWRGAGILDPLANFVHSAFGFPDGGREDFPEDSYDVVLENDRGRVADLDDGSGWGDAILSSKSLVVDGTGTFPAASLLAELRLPTAEKGLGADGFDLGFAIGASERFFERFIAYGGLGGTWFLDDEFERIDYQRLRAYGFVAVEWQVFDWASAVVQAESASPLLDGYEGLAGPQAYVEFGAKIDVGERTRLGLAFIENIQDQDSTADFGMYFGLDLVF